MFDSDRQAVQRVLHLARAFPRLFRRRHDQARRRDRAAGRDRLDDPRSRGQAAGRRFRGFAEERAALPDPERGPHLRGSAADALVRRRVPLHQPPGRSVHARIPQAIRRAQSPVRHVRAASPPIPDHAGGDVRPARGDHAAVGGVDRPRLHQWPRRADPPAHRGDRPGFGGQFLRPGAGAGRRGRSRASGLDLQQDDLRTAPAAEPPDRGQPSDGRAPRLHRGGAVRRPGGGDRRRRARRRHRAQSVGAAAGLRRGRGGGRGDRPAAGGGAAGAGRDPAGGARRLYAHDPAADHASAGAGASAPTTSASRPDRSIAASAPSSPRSTT